MSIAYIFINLTGLIKRLKQYIMKTIKIVLNSGKIASVQVNSNHDLQSLLRRSNAIGIKTAAHSELMQTIVTNLAHFPKTAFAAGAERKYCGTRPYNEVRSFVDNILRSRAGRKSVIIALRKSRLGSGMKAKMSMNNDVSDLN